MYYVAETTSILTGQVKASRSGNSSSRAVFLFWPIHPSCHPENEVISGVNSLMYYVAETTSILTGHVKASRSGNSPLRPVFLFWLIHRLGHAVNCMHTLTEIYLLGSKYPKTIQIYFGGKKNNCSREMLMYGYVLPQQLWRNTAR